MRGGVAPVCTRLMRDDPVLADRMWSGGVRGDNEHPVGNGPEAAYQANARIKTDDMVLAMIDDALKGL